MKQTPLHAIHVNAGAKMVPFAGWDMPVQYAGVIAEVEAVRKRCGIFDASHMGEFELRGSSALTWLDSLTSNSLQPVANDQARYSLMLHDQGGVIDDLIIYRFANDHLLVVCNASNIESVWTNLQKHLPEQGVSLRDRSADMALLAVQGPQARSVVGQVLGLDADTMPRRFRWQLLPSAIADGIPCLLARTGYTGEDGVELFVPSDKAAGLWSQLVDAGAEPCGLGARDVCRIEAGLPLYGHEMDLDNGPEAASLMFAVDLNKGAFVGREALVAGTDQTTIGLQLTTRGVPREGYPVSQYGEIVGKVTSGTFSPTLQAGIAMARVSKTVDSEGDFAVQIRKKKFPAAFHKLPFIHQFK